MPAPLLVGVPRIPARLKGGFQAGATQRRRSRGAGIGLGDQADMPDVLERAADGIVIRTSAGSLFT